MGRVHKAIRPVVTDQYIHLASGAPRVTHNITKYPILARWLNLPDWIRNASGNGGGLLLGYMLADFDPSLRSDDDEEVALFMREIYQRVLELIFASCRQRSHNAPTATARAEILKNYGLHNVKHFAWDMAHSDPYRALTYDTLHSDDLGKWGAHLWELLLEVIGGIEDGKKRLSEFMRRFPRWQDLKHFNNVAETHFADGQSFFDILKCILPCATQILPANSVLIICIRAYLKYRMIVGMTCMTERRLQLLRQYVQDYQRCCEQVTKVHGKSFKFYKQHFASHAERDIREKGTLNHASTRPGEGFIQEAAEAYSQTSKKNVDPQMTRIDENKEAIAQIRMVVEHDKAARLAAASREDTSSEPQNPPPEDADTDGPATWSFGSPSSGLITSCELETAQRNDTLFRDFDLRLRLFLVQSFPEERLRFHEPLKTRLFKLAYIRYQSREDWREERDLV
ncbi:hypothetical protein HDZ31DRAFT_68438 [Schizophyllum fasciatum]